jgi:hypothetical protein
VETSQFLYGIFKNEFVLLKGEDSLLAHLKTAQEQKMVNVDFEKGFVLKADDVHGARRLNFMTNFL